MTAFARPATASITLDAQRWRSLDHQIVDDPCEAVAQRVRVSSRGRPWNGLSVWLQDGPVEDLYIPAMRKHCIVIRRTQPTRLQQYQGGQANERAWLPGEAVIVPAGTPSFWRSQESRDNLHVDIDPSWLARAAGDDVDASPALRSCFGVNDPVLRQFGHLLLGSLDSNASLHAGFADGLAIALATHLLEHHADAGAQPRRTGALTRRQLDHIVAAIEADLAEDWSLDKLAALLQLSPFHFARAFKAACGETPHRFVLRLRLEQARRQVLATAQPLIDIAVDAGFVSLSHFGQAFRRQWGVSPSQLRRTH